MKAEDRRAQLKKIIEAAPTPQSASSLAAKFSVSRQVIVGDIALLRAAGASIEATPRGYVSPGERPGLIKTVACVHTGDQMGQELNIIVDQGCTAVDVVVEHPVYGQLTGRLDISSRYDVERFVEKYDSQIIRPLSELTGGIHLHNLVCPDEAAYQRVLSALEKAGFLFRQD